LRVTDLLQSDVELQFLTAASSFDLERFPGQFVEEIDPYVFDTGDRIIVQRYEGVVYF
jgi:hypothetical protein